jgi:hypothetical protein
MAKKNKNKGKGKGNKPPGDDVIIVKPPTTPPPTPGPNITQLIPTSGAVGSVVNIIGTNFGAVQGSSTIRFGAISGTATSWSGTLITTTVPIGAVTGGVFVRVNGIDSAGAIFAVTGLPTSCPVGAVHIAPGTNIQPVVNANPAGTNYCIEAGIHRLQSVTPKNNDSFFGEIGAIISGAKILTGWSFNGGSNDWSVGGQTQNNGSIGNGNCVVGWPMCGSAEDLWFDGVIKVRKASRGALVGGDWYFDLAADIIYVKDDPNSSTVETSVNASAFTGSASGVTLQNLIIERYANHAQTGAVVGNATTNWVINNCTFRYNHGIGLRIGPGMLVTGGRTHNNSQMGIGGTGNNAIIDGMEIDFNNLQFEQGWEGGGTKFTSTTVLMIRNCYSHNNIGPGIWCDINNDQVTYEFNTIEDNEYAGIFHEISYSAIIRNNICRRNGRVSSIPIFVSGGNILIAASGGTGIDIHDNLLEGANGVTLMQQNRGSGSLGPYLTQNVNTHNNTTQIPAGIWVTGGVSDFGTEMFSSRNNTFDFNTYNLQTAPASPFAWDSGLRNQAYWQGTAGFDLNGTFNY